MRSVSLGATSAYALRSNFKHRRKRCAWRGDATSCSRDKGRKASDLLSHLRVSQCCEDARAAQHVAREGRKDSAKYGRRNSEFAV